ncbi:hypothetical protein Pmani_023425 [Petrolisthes manimaculis]|uniref:Thioredoxin domain-containing protein n=1 Tax=Petrolisthes manimaculis TaxID=1843537 RepID=A0AAE1PBN4_9EUCA|nr:hypothetical protein Pmani_023425 [Petrolisthes manimaculis]
MAVAAAVTKSYFIPVFLFLLAWTLPAAAKLDFLNEDEVKQAIIDEKYIVILFSEGSECTGGCEELEDTLASIREDVVEAVNAWVIRTHSPTLALQYGLVGKSLANSIVLFSNGVPMLYTGPPDDDEIMLSFLVTNPESSLHSLTDVNFEHLTQASSGATTGDWLVMFVRDDCDDCTRLRAIIETVAAGLKNRKNVAMVNRDTDGGQTTRRFAVKTFPSFLLFRQSRLFRYTLPVVDAASLTAFTIDGFRNARAENIPHPKTAFDDLTEFCADWLRENPQALYGGCGVLGLLVLVFILVKIRAAVTSSPPPAKKDTKKKK